VNRQSSWLRLVRTNGGETSLAGERGPPLANPTGEERAVMAAYGIEFDGCGFRFAGYRHELLADAVDEARLSGRGRE
jgi:hypothetical protein